MNDARRRRKAKQMRRDAQRSTGKQPGSPEETLLVDEVRQALAGHPLDLLGVVSVLIEATKPAPAGWLPPDDQRESVDLARLLDGFLHTPAHETTALLAVLADVLDDPELRAQCRREVDARRDTAPRWLADLADVEVYRAVRVTHAPGAGEEVLIGARLAGGDELTCAVSIDGDTSGMVADAFLVPDSIGRVLVTAEGRNTDPDTRFADMALVEARMWLERGLARTPVVLEPSDTWPACRPIVQWLTRRTAESGH